MTRTLVAVLALSASAVVLAAGCGSSNSSIADYCTKFCACAKCSADQETQCESDATESQKDAAKAGCASEFQDSLECQSAASCKGGALDTHACLDEQKAEFACESASTP